jgi:hypothetical protein
LNYWYVWIVGALLIAITAGFILSFVWPAIRLRQEFVRVIAALKKVRSETTGISQLREHITATVMKKASFVHVWIEYAQTLHPQKQEGQNETRWRATALADTFFTDQALVDTPLKTEYYKHLPGIMTGLGIIGTFTGLINGLANFDVSIDPGQAQTQLRTLINTVGHAFVVSAIAITLAMIFTWVEKSIVTACYRLTEHLRQEIDSLFETGADVEYLERLVAAAETSAKDVLHLKDTLAEQIVRALAEQTQLQIAASDRNSEHISSDLGRLLATSLSQPISDIATAVNVVSARQDETVTRMITEALNGFSRQMENMFAGQMRELHDVLSNTNGSMREMVNQFSVMAGRINIAGKDAVDTMSSRIEANATLTEERQLAMQRQTDIHAEQMRTMIARSQADSGEMLRQLLAKLGHEVAVVVGAVHEQSKSAVDSQQVQVGRLTQVVSDTVGGMSGQIESLVAMSVATNHKLQETIEALARTTGDAIRDMNTGAEKLGAAASSFADAGTHVAATVGESSKAAVDIRLAADSMKRSAAAAREMLGDYSVAHDAFARLVSDLKGTVDRAKREASLSAELTDRLESAAAKLSYAQQQADTYLAGVSRVLDHAHQAFADSVERTLREANRRFHSELSQAVGLLSGAIVDLGGTVEALAEQDHSRTRKAGSA